MRGEFLDLDGARLYYYAAGSRGSGEPIVLLHGFPTSSYLWSGVVPLLPEGHRVVVLDLLGFGRSDPPAGRPVTLRAHADRVVAVLDHLGIRVAALVGHDVGGGIAQLVAVHYPDRVSRLGLVSTVAFNDWPSRDVRLARAILPMMRLFPPGWLLSLVRNDLTRGFTDGDRAGHDLDRYLRVFADAGGRDALVAHLTSLVARDTEAIAPRLGEIRAPTAIVWGERDPFRMLRVAERLRDAIPGSTLDVVPGARHFLPSESAGAVAAAIRQLMAR